MRYGVGRGSAGPALPPTWPSGAVAPTITTTTAATISAPIRIWRPPNGPTRPRRAGGGALLVAPSSAVRLMRHEAGGPALRLLDGVAATVATRATLHVAVHETDLLVEQRSGALLLRQAPGEVTCLRGEADLLLSEGRRFAIPPGASG